MKQNGVESRRPVEIEMNDIVLPDYTNAYARMFGGKLLEFVDRAAALCSMRYSGELVVTASTEAVDFLAPIFIGQAIRILAKIVFTGRTSMMVRVNVWAEDMVKKTESHCLTAHVNMVAVNAEGKPIPVPRLIVETDEEKCSYDEALAIRETGLARRRRNGNCDD
jgi:acyl-CoA hydrolase